MNKNKYVVQPSTMTARVYRLKDLLGVAPFETVVSVKKDVVKWLLPETGRVEGV